VRPTVTTTHPTAHVRRSCLALTASMLLALACNQPPGGGTGAAGAAGPTACADYAKKVCDEAGANSPLCESVKQTTAIMPPAACAAAATDMSAVKQKVAEAHKACDELIAKLCADLGPETETCGMVRTQTKSFPADRCTVMLQNYDKVVAELKRREEGNKPLTPDKMAVIAKSDAPSFGPANAKVTIVEFSDFQCPYCSKAATAVQQLKAKYGTRARFVFRQFPLPFHTEAHLAAQASLAAHAQGKFWQYHDRLFADQSKLDRASLEATAKEVGLNLAAFKKALDGKTHAAAVDADLELGKGAAVNGTPTMFLNGKRVPNPGDVASISKEIDAALGGKG
jgi:protein-disulfide isomerase